MIAPMKIEPEMIAVAWKAFRGDRRGQLLGPGPGFVEALSAVALLIRAAALEEAWQPIDTAPRDGTLVLLFRPLARETGDPIVTIRRTTDTPRHCWPSTIPEGADGANFTEGSCYASHWMTLPSSPTLASNGEKPNG